MKNCAVLYSFLFFMVASCSALHCYVCNSAFDEGCDDSPPPDIYLTNCSKNHFQPGHHRHIPNLSYSFILCRKLIIDIPRQRNDDTENEPHTRVFRSCGWIKDDYATTSNCRWVAGGSKVQNLQCACSEDGCNTTGKLHAVPASILSLVSLTVTFVHGYLQAI